jgi:hypothetical protein
MTVGGHGGMACMAQEYHGDGDADGPLCKIGNMDITDVQVKVEQGSGKIQNRAKDHICHEHVS